MELNVPPQGTAMEIAAHSNTIGTLKAMPATWNDHTCPP